MDDETSVQVNFARPVPLFPLETAALLPQQVLPMHVFEPRYVELVEHTLDRAGQFALAIFKGDQWKKDYHGRPPLMPAVCLAQIVQHERLPDGRYNILVQGVCRARIVKEVRPIGGPPAPAVSQAENHPGPRLFRSARLEPVGIDPQEETKLYGVRERLTELLEDGPLTQLTQADWVVERIRNEEIPTAVVLELVSFALPIHREIRYRLLAEGDAAQRADLISRELRGLREVLRMASAQHPEAWPKGMSWN